MTGESVSVRRARVEDAAGLWALASAFATSFAPTRRAFDRTLPLLLERPDTLVLVAVTDGGAVLGYLLGSAHLTFSADGPVAWVEELMVQQDRRRIGIGRRLVSAAEAWSTEVGAAYVALASRRAADFYIAIGYEASATFFRRVLPR